MAGIGEQLSSEEPESIPFDVSGNEQAADRPAMTQEEAQELFDYLDAYGMVRARGLIEARQRGI